MKPFNHNYFLGYVNQVSPQFIKIHFPSSSLLEKFNHNGTFYSGGNVGNFIVVEGEEFGFLARIIEIDLPDSEKKLMTEKAIQNDETPFHPSGKAELLLSFSVFEPKKIEKTVSKYPAIGAKVYSCSDAQIAEYIKEFGAKKDDENNVYADLGKLTANDAKCRVSLNSIFGRHCAIVGTTGGGKSWTVAKLISETLEKTNNKIILIDATGEYYTLGGKSLILGEDAYFPYQKLTINDLFFLLRPTGQSQRPVLIEAIRSLKIRRFANNNINCNKTSTQQFKEHYTDQNTITKNGKNKEKFFNFYQDNIEKIEDGNCNFDINYLAQQIKEECVSDNPFNSNDYSKWGNFYAKTYDYQTSLISRITDLINNDNFNKVLGFNNVTANNKSIVYEIDSFLKDDNKEQMLRISFEEISSSFSIKEITANALASFLLNLARKGKFKENCITIILDEAHQFLNKNVKDEFFETQTLDSFDLISKECRKYGLFLCLSTQMPRDIPVGTLSQMGTFIVHRLINELDKKSIENACSSANKNALSFLPILGEGEALLVGVDFPMPLIIKIDEPSKKPNSKTPKFKPKTI